MALTAGSIEIKIFAGLARLQSDMNKANKTVDAAMRNIDKSVGVAKAAFSGLVGTVTLGNLVKLADEYKRFDSQLQLSTGTLKAYNEAYANVVRISKTAQSDIGAVGVFYARLNNNMKDLNVTQKQVADVTSTVAYALRVNNATVQETSSVMLQLSQSFGSGKLNGQEFLAVAEGAPALLRQLANSMGVPFGALRDLAAQGLITREALLKAFSDPEYKKSLEAQVQQVGTISSSVTVLMNNLKLYIGEQDKATGASKILSGIIKLLAENINLLATGAIVLLITRFGTLVSSMWASIQASRARQVELVKETVMLERKAAAEAAATVALQASMANNAKATTVWAARNSAVMTETAAITAGVAARTTALAGASNAARLAMGALGGPIGIVTTALTLGVTAWAAWGSSGLQSASKIAEVIDRINKGLASINDVKLIELQQKALKAERDALIEGEKRKITTGARAALNPEAQTRAALEYNLELERLNRIIKDNDDAIAKYNSTQKENTKLVSEADKVLLAYIEKNDLKSKLLADYNNQIKTLGYLLKEGKISQADYNAEIEKWNKKINDLTGATKRLKEDEKSRFEIIKAEAIAQKELLIAQENARRDAIKDADKVTESLQQELDKRNEQLEILLNGEYAYRLLEIARMEDAIATAQQNVEQDKLNGASELSIQYANEYISALKQQVALKKSIAEKDATIKNIEDVQKAEKKAAEEEIANNKKIAKELQIAFTSAFEDAIVKGNNFRDVLLGIEADIMRIVTRTLVTQPFSNWLTGQVNNFDLSSIIGSMPIGEAGTGDGLLGFVSKFLPSFDVGTPYVQSDMMANIHKGERILTAEENRAYTAGQTGSVVINNNFTINGNMNSQTQAQIAAQVGMSVNRSLARNK